MAPSFHFSPCGDALTVERARAALFLWLEARRQTGRFTVAGGANSPGRQELRWLGLEGDSEADSGETPEWLQSLPPLEESPPSPWGQWSGRTAVAELRELGVLPEALVNFLALTAWEPP
ncbi:MAG: hypothetical protein ACE5G6_07565, partial [Terriglobia bacterium]